MSEGLYALVSLSEMKRRLGDPVGYDDEISDLIKAVSGLVEDLLDTVFIKRSITETHTQSDFLHVPGSGRQRLYLYKRPIQSVELINDPAGNVLEEGINYIVFPNYIEGNFWTPFGVTGMVEFWEFSYVAGHFENTAQIASDAGSWKIVEAVKMEVASRFGPGGVSSASANVKSKSVGDLSISYGPSGSVESYGGLSADVMAMLSSFEQITL